MEILRIVKGGKKLVGLCADGGGSCTGPECYKLGIRNHEDFDADGIPEHHLKQSDVDLGACVFYNICTAFTGEKLESKTTHKTNIFKEHGVSLEARLLKQKSWKKTTYKVYGTCVDRVGDPLPQGCFYMGESECPVDMKKVATPQVSTEGLRENIAPSGYTYCAGDFTCTRQIGAWLMQGDRVNGDWKDFAETTTCETSADCCGSWSRSRTQFPSGILRSNVPIVCVPYSTVSSNTRMAKIVKPKKGANENVCWFYGGAGEIYLTNAVRIFPKSVAAVDKLFVKDKLPSLSYLQDELCDNSPGRRLEERKLVDHGSACENPCSGAYDLSIYDATCNCFDGLDTQNPDAHTLNSEGLYLTDCLRLCWQNSVKNGFTKDAAAETCTSGKCVLDCSSYRFTDYVPTPGPTPEPW
eukprot:Platyproteum_vivax@DN6401_c0_g1_i1.p1